MDSISDLIHTIEVSFLVLVQCADYQSVESLYRQTKTIMDGYFKSKEFQKLLFFLPNFLSQFNVQVSQVMQLCTIQLS